MQVSLVELPSFLFFRVTGKQVAPEFEEGTQLIPTASPSITTKYENDINDEVLSVNDGGGFLDDLTIEGDTTR